MYRKTSLVVVELSHIRSGDTETEYVSIRLGRQRKEREFAKEIRSGWWFAGVGMLISIVLGDIFWHHLFALGLGDFWVVYPLSGMCAAVITLTFVRAELFHGMLLRTLRGILKDNHLMRTAVNVEPENMQIPRDAQRAATQQQMGWRAFFSMFLFL
jgi:hypothetical protein